MTNKYSINHKIEELISGRLNQSIEDQINESVQAIAEIGSVDSNSAYRKVQLRLKKEAKYRMLLTSLSRIAAVLFIPLLIASGVLLNRQLTLKENQQFAIQEITSPAGVRSQIILPDGSNVWLNAESTIKFKVPFDQKSRDISLSGEAFFNVQKNPNVPFIVNTGAISVKVLGTRFNYKAFKDENKIEIVLTEGKVSLTTDGEKRENEVIMKPGDRAVFDKTSNLTKITNEKIEKYIAWHDGKLVFDETPMPEVAAQIGRWFGVEVVIADAKIKNYRITTTFENESLHQVLELLRLSSPIEIKYIQATINKSNGIQTK
jgi:ferric-dicitrate binding protein FerR (iron transport regulator)